MLPQQRPNESVVELLRQYRAARPPPAKKARKQASPPPSPTQSSPQAPPADEDDQEDSAEADDPYRVPATLERLTRVSHEEYDTSVRSALHPSHSFDLARLEQVSRHAYWNAKLPRDHYTQDTAPLLDALVLGAAGMELVARRAATQVPYEQLLVVENGDTGRIIERLCADGEARQAVQAHAEQYLFALMALENATRYQPAHLRDALK